MSVGGDNFEPMQVDPEENDNDEGMGIRPDIRMVHQVDHAMVPMIGGAMSVNGGPIVGAVNGGPGIIRGGGLAAVGGAALPRGDLHGEDVRVFYNIENPSIDLETYAQGMINLANTYSFPRRKTLTNMKYTHTQNIS